MSRRTGMTLLEVAIVAVILAIIVGIALSRFTRTIQNSQSVQAEQNLNLIRGAEMRYFQDQGTYTNNMGLLAVTLPGAGPFVYAIDNASATNFRASATGLGTVIYICRDVQPTTIAPACP